MGGGGGGKTEEVEVEAGRDLMSGLMRSVLSRVEAGHFSFSLMRFVSSCWKPFHFRRPADASPSGGARPAPPRPAPSRLVPPRPVWPAMAQFSLVVLLQRHVLVLIIASDTLWDSGRDTVKQVEPDVSMMLG